MEDFYTEMEKDILQISSLPADELKHAEERRIQSELERVKHEAEIQRRREARVHRTSDSRVRQRSTGSNIGYPLVPGFPADFQ